MVTRDGNNRGSLIHQDRANPFRVAGVAVYDPAPVNVDKGITESEAVSVLCAL